MTPDYTLTGPILLIGATVSREGKNGKTYRDREFIVEKRTERRTGDDYVQPICFKVSGDRCDTLDNFNSGDCVAVSADVDGREWNGRHFVNLMAWKIVHVDADGTPEKPVGSGLSRPAEHPHQEPRERALTRNEKLNQRPAADDSEDEIPF